MAINILLDLIKTYVSSIITGKKITLINVIATILLMTIGLAVYAAYIAAIHLLFGYIILIIIVYLILRDYVVKVKPEIEKKTVELMNGIKNSEEEAVKNGVNEVSNILS